MFPILTQALAYLSRVCGFDTVDSFPPGHVHARTHWSGAHFDIASDLKPDQIERALCEKIANTPMIFAQIANPTPDMQRVLLGMIGTRIRHGGAQPLDLVALLAGAYRSPYTKEALPGLRAAIEENNGDPRSVLAFLSESSGFGVIDAAPHQSGLKLVGR